VQIILVPRQKFNFILIIFSLDKIISEQNNKRNLFV
jgi:hypothetical protein